VNRFLLISSDKIKKKSFFTVQWRRGKGWGQLPLRQFYHAGIFSSFRKNSLKIQNLGPEIPIWGECRGKVKFSSLVISSVGNLQLPVRKGQLPVLPNFSSDDAAGAVRWRHCGGSDGFVLVHACRSQAVQRAVQTSNTLDEPD